MLIYRLFILLKDIFIILIWEIASQDWFVNVFNFIIIIYTHFSIKYQIILALCLFTWLLVLLNFCVVETMSDTNFVLFTEGILLTFQDMSGNAIVITTNQSFQIGNCSFECVINAWSIWFNVGELVSTFTCKQNHSFVLWFHFSCISSQESNHIVFWWIFNFAGLFIWMQ